ncbi:DUF4192 domain-containing protein [Ornithinimicrobium flavum]|uniref:DUF4192 domain-containing protein n=1 Tax=Ornithinimicrobium flavum TaxID=1288636 RepID=UPI001305344A|nr:DUF4192 domain-containing protein [Ornithinimicrobium flavum]
MTNHEPGGRSPRPQHRIHPVPDAPVVAVRGMSQVTALVPHLLGYRPDHSLVVLATTPEPGSRRGVTWGAVAMTMRVDLPPEPELVNLAHSLADPVRRGLGERADGALAHAVVYDLPETGGEPSPDYLAGLRAALHLLCDQVGLTLHDVILVRDGGRQHRPVLLATEEVRPAWAPVPGAADVPAVADLVLQGRSPLGSREEVAARVRRRDERASAATSLAVDILSLAPGRLDDGVALAGLGAWVVHGEPEPGARERAWIAVLLHDKTVRDAVLARWIPDLFDLTEVLPPGEAADLARHVPPWPAGERTAPVERLLTLAGQVPLDLAAPLLTIAGFCSWAQGEGTVAVEACAHALEVDPDYRMAQLLDRGLATGLRPPALGGAGASRGADRRGVA